MSDNSFKDQVTVITGAGGTLCSAIALHLAKKGAKVALLGRTREKLEITAQKITSAGGNCMICTCDVTDQESVEKAAEKILTEWGACRFLLNGAGGNNINAMTTTFCFDPLELSDVRPEEMRGFFHLSMDAFERVLKTNTMGTVIPTQIFARSMAINGGGVILNFASMNTYRPLTRVAPYAMSKAAISNWTQWLATYLAPANIRVNAIAPGFFVNERSRQYLGTPESGLTQRGKNVIAHTPMKRFGEACDLFGAVSYLLSDEDAGFVTGITLPVDGGFLSHSGV